MDGTPQKKNIYNKGLIFLGSRIAMKKKDSVLF